MEDIQQKRIDWDKDLLVHPAHPLGVGQDRPWMNAPRHSSCQNRPSGMCDTVKAVLEISKMHENQESGRKSSCLDERF